MPGFIEPQPATLKASAPSKRQWIHEIKFDGNRLQAHVTKAKLGFTRVAVMTGRQGLHEFVMLLKRSRSNPPSSTENWSSSETDVQTSPRYRPNSNDKANSLSTSSTFHTSKDSTSGIAADRAEEGDERPRTRGAGRGSSSLLREGNVRRTLARYRTRRMQCKRTNELRSQGAKRPSSPCGRP